MSVKLRRLWLDSIGDNSARFADVLLDFTDEASNPLDTIVWLRNGGGKTSLLALTFSLVLPNQTDFLGGREQQRCLADYIQSGDTAHVVAEWETALGPVITGAVYEWPERRRPAEPAKHQAELVKRWYVGRPGKGFGFGEFPVRTREGRARLEQYVASLRAVAKQRPGAVLIASSGAEWKKALESFQLDQAVFRYQKSMNRGEGSIDDVFRFATAEQFIDFMVDLVIDADEPNSFAANLRAVTTKVASRPRLELERGFCDGAAERLAPVATSWVQRQRTHEQLQHRSVEAWELQTQLTAGARAARAEAEALVEQRRVVTEERNQVSTTRRTAAARGADARRVAAQLWVREATAKLESIEAQQAAAADTARAWELLEVWLEHESAVRQLAEIDELIAKRAEGAEPLRAARNGAAARLLARYMSRAAVLETQLAEIDSRKNAASAVSNAATSALRQADGDRRAAELAEQAARQELERIETALAAAIVQGDLGPGEEPSAGLDRLQNRDSVLTSEDGRLADRLIELRGELGDVDAEIRRLQGERATAAAERDAARSTLETVEASVAEFVGHERVRELAQTDAVALWAAGDLVVRKLDTTVADARRELVQLEVESRRDLRNREALGDGGLLPPSDDVVEILRVLDDQGIAGTSGLAFLSASINRKRWDETLAAHPGLLSGVVVEAADLDRARRVVIDAGLHPASLVTVAAKHDLLDVDGLATFVVPPSPALFDPHAATVERDRLDRVIATYDGRRAEIEAREHADAALRSRLAEFLTAHPAGIMERLQGSVRELEARVERLSGEIDVFTTHRSELDTETLQASNRRDEIATERRKLAAALTRLSALTHDAGTRPQLTVALDDATTRIAAAIALRAEASAQQAAATGELEACAEQRRAVSGELDTLRAATGRVTFVGDHELRSDEPGAPTDALEAAFERAHRAYDNEVNDAALSSQRDALVRRRAELVGRLPSERDPLHATVVALVDDSHAATAPSRARRRAAIEDDRRKLAAAHALADADTQLAEREANEQGPPTGVLDPSELPTTRAAADELRLGEETRATRLRSEETELDNRLTALQGRVAELGRRADTFELLVSNLVNLVGAAPVGTAEVPAPFDGSDEEARSVVGELSDRLRQAKDQAAAAAAELAGAAERLRKFCTQSQYTALAGIADGAVLGEPEVLGPHAERLAKELRDRVVVLDAELGSIEQDRQILVTDLVGQVKSVLDLLNRAGRTLTMPAGLGAWAGLSFLHVHFERPTDDAELRRLLAEEIDRIVAAGNVPEGLTCLKRAVHAAVPKGFRVSVLKPSAELATNRHPITRMGGWSGGEKLTAAVLLYCTLARLRASRRRQTLTDVGAGVLVLDNPLGKASYVGFIALQRRVAAELGVQLVYTTAVRDLGAVGKFPNVVRCRNVSAPGRGRSFVDVVAREGAAHGIEITGTVSAVRVLRADDELDDSSDDDGDVEVSA